LVLRYRPRLVAVAQRITNHREDAEDAAQKSLAMPLPHLDRFPDKARFSTWLMRIAMK
jgi:DNA-directed RNA polymerase specialized sigma24 family protein